MQQTRGTEAGKQRFDIIIAYIKETVLIIYFQDIFRVTVKVEGKRGSGLGRTRDWERKKEEERLRKRDIVTGRGDRE